MSQKAKYGRYMTSLQNILNYIRWDNINYFEPYYEHTNILCIHCGKNRGDHYSTNCGTISDQYIGTLLTCFSPKNDEKLSFDETEE